MFELILRVKEGLPFATLLTIQLIIESAIARAQRDSKVILSDHLWMGNHVHMILMSLCPEACTRFYQEVQKKITDSIKKLLGVRRLNIWEGDPVLAEILDLEAAISKIAYVYANPARANLVDTIYQYPGLSSWYAFKGIAPDIEASVSKMVPWVRLPSIERLPCRSLSERQDRFLYSKLLAANRKRHPLELKPNAWMKVFGIEDEKEIASINDRIMQRVSLMEKEAREKNE